MARFFVLKMDGASFVFVFSFYFVGGGEFFPDSALRMEAQYTEYKYIAAWTPPTELLYLE